MGPKGRFYSYMYLVNVDWDRCCIWVELPVQRRLCPIFVRDVGSSDIHECFHGLTGSQRTPWIWGVTAALRDGFLTAAYNDYSNLKIKGNFKLVIVCYN